MAGDASTSRRGFMLTTAAGAAGGMIGQKAVQGSGHPHQVRKLSGISTGFAQLDELTGGLHRGELTLLASRRAAGQTALALNITDFVTVERAVATVYFCFHSSILEIARRLVFCRGGVSYTEMYRHARSAEIQQRLTDAVTKICESPLHIDDEPMRTAPQIREVAEQINSGLPATDRLGLLVVDHLHRVAADNPDGKSRDEHLMDVARELRTMAHDLNVAVLGLVQLNCPQSILVDKDPTLNQLCDNQSAADTVLLLRGPQYDPAPVDRGGAGPKGTSWVSVIPRTGRCVTTAELCWQSQYVRFSEFGT